MITDEEAIEIARAEHERRGHRFKEPISVSRGLLGWGLRITVSANGDKVGGGRTFVRIHPKTRKIVTFSYLPR